MTHDHASYESPTLQCRCMCLTSSALSGPTAPHPTRTTSCTSVHLITTPRICMQHVCRHICVCKHALHTHTQGWHIKIIKTRYAVFCAIRPSHSLTIILEKIAAKESCVQVYTSAEHWARIHGHSLHIMQSMSMVITYRGLARWAGTSNQATAFPRHGQRPWTGAIVNLAICVEDHYIQRSCYVGWHITSSLPHTRLAALDRRRTCM